MARIMTLLGTISAAALSLSVEAGYAQAPACGSHDVVVQSLADKFREKPQSVGVINDDTVLEVFVSDAGTWTILVTDTDGQSCIMSAGEGWDSNTVVAALPNL